MARVLQDPRIWHFLSEDPPTLEQLQRQYDFLTRGKSPDDMEHWLTWILMALDGCADPLGFIQATIKEPETAHIAYVITPSHWRQGYASEAVSALLDVVFERYRVARAIAEMDTRNEASIAMVRSLGFRHVKTLQDVNEFKGSRSHEHVYELEPAEWRRSARQARE